MANLEAEIQKRQKELQHGLYRSKFDYNDQFSPMKPVIFPCRTSHTRLFPKKHSFSYSYLLVGIPVGWRGYVSAILSADLKTLPWSDRSPRNGWFNVDSANHLARGEHMHGLQGKLEDYLGTQNENIEDYPYSYLVTAPSFLGYSFNPVSFWYLYDQKKSLRAMILEVNNTFDERRMYFLKNDCPENLVPDGKSVSESVTSTKTADTESSSQNTKPSKFTAAWSKDFHVSPFNSRKGAYSLSATDPFTIHLVDGNLKSSCGQVNNTITLSSSKNHPKLIARVFSASDSIDPYALSESQIAKFVLSWWWVGFVTFPRIVREAGKLFFRRKLHVWFRPEVLKDSLGRKETGDERAIAIVFKQYLQACVKDSKSSIPLQFTCGISTMPPSETFVSDVALSNSSSKTQPLVLKILTPLFYAQLARHTSIHDFLNSSLSDTDPQGSTFFTSNPGSLLELFDDRISLPSAPEDPTTASTSKRWRWLLLAKLRHGTFSQLDALAQKRYANQDSTYRAYRKAVIKILISDRLAFGMTAIIDAVLFIFRIWLCWICAQWIDALVALNDKFYSGTPLAAMGVFLSCVGLHLWAFAGSLI